MPAQPLTIDSPAPVWKAAFVDPLVEWYAHSARVLPWRTDPTPYRVWVSEIMLQQTRVETVLPYFERFMQQLPDVYALAAAPLQKLHKLWEGLGYYSRARNMQRAAQEIVENFGGEFPRTLPQWEALPGIGTYTAGAVLSIAFGAPVPAVDGNVLRVLSRAALYCGDVTKPAGKKALCALCASLVPQTRPGDFNQALMDLGAGLCRPNGEPLCGQCPVKARCGAHLAGRASELPVKAPKKERAVQERTVFAVCSAGGVLLRRRPDSGLLAGLWEFPNVQGKLQREEVRGLIRERGAGDVTIRSLAPARHIFTHLEWRMTGYQILLQDVPPVREPYAWAGLSDIGGEYAIPSAFKAYSEAVKSLIEQ